MQLLCSVKDGLFRQYRGSRDRDEFINFVEERKWADVEPISSWKSPDSLQMSVVSGFFKLSMLLRNVHTHITEDHGIPYWGSYLLFALATIVVGAVLGLILVFIIDCFYPAKPAACSHGKPVITPEEKEKLDPVCSILKTQGSVGKGPRDIFSFIPLLYLHLG